MVHVRPQEGIKQGAQAATTNLQGDQERGYAQGPSHSKDLDQVPDREIPGPTGPEPDAMKVARPVLLNRRA